MNAGVLAPWLFFLASPALATSSIELMKANIDPKDVVSLQRGAGLFVNYCLSCHSAAYMRFSRAARDLQIPDDVAKSNLLFVTDKIENTMQAAMRAQDAEKWFGVAPPDLSVIARAKGVDWLYTFLNAFYLDPNRPHGVNNRLFEDTAMPHVLWELQGWQTPVYRTSKDDEGNEERILDHLQVNIPGKLDESSYQAGVRDLVNFLAYVAEPAKMLRERLGASVLLFLGVFSLLCYALKREYWKDV
ncbi:MAG: cytochrome c1, partial [Gammaproteobacteria bacterium]